MLVLSRRHCSTPLSNSISNFFSNFIITVSDVNLCSMASVSVISLSEFILSIPLKSSALFNTLWWLVCSRSFFACLVYSIYFENFSLSIATKPSAYCVRQFFLSEISTKYQPSLSTLFPLHPHLFYLRNIFAIFYLDFL